MSLRDGQNPRQCADFVPLGHHGVHLLDRRDCGRGPRDRHFFGVAQVAFGHAPNRRRHRRREKCGYPTLGNLGGDFLNVLGESHSEHFVGLVEHEIAHCVQTKGAAVHEVHNAPRGADHHLRPAFERPELGEIGGPAVHGGDVDPARFRRKRLDCLRSLHRQLARRGENEGLDLALVGVDMGEEGKGEGRRFARSRLGDADDVFSPQKNRDGRGLNRRGRRKAELLHRGEEVFGQSEVVEKDVAGIDVAGLLGCGVGSRCDVVVLVLAVAALVRGAAVLVRGAAVPALAVVVLGGGAGALVQAAAVFTIGGVAVRCVFFGR